MADPKTDLNESLSCIALRYIDKYPNHDVEKFKNMILEIDENESNIPSAKERFQKSLENNQIGTDTLKRHSTYKSAYGQKDEKGNLKYETWIEGSFYSAQAIRNKFNIVLDL